jgi:hypothetical protein
MLGRLRSKRRLVFSLPKMWRLVVLPSVRCAQVPAQERHSFCRGKRDKLQAVVWVGFAKLLKAEINRVCFKLRPADP